MMKMYKIRKSSLLWLLLMAVSLTGCDDVYPQMDKDELDAIFAEDQHDADNALKICSLSFSSTYRTFSVMTDVLHDYGPYPLSDSTRVKVAVSETVNGVSLTERTLSTYLGGRNLEGESVAKASVKMLVIVDLTLPQEVIDYQRECVGTIGTVFDHDNLFVSFIYGDTITESMLATDFVKNHYFVHQPSDHKLLYRGILEKKREMQSDSPHWADAKSKVLMVFSDGAVYYDDNMPMDVEHYQLQDELIKPATKDDKGFIAYYIDNRIIRDADNGDEANVLKVFCRYHWGDFYPKFNWRPIADEIIEHSGGDTADNIFYFSNPDDKAYRGFNHNLIISFLAADTDSLIAKVSTNIHLGSIYDPVIVNGRHLLYVIFIGLLVGLVILALLWLGFQIVAPYVRYKLFCNKYVLTYTGANMSVGNVMVSQKCYLCKGEFKEGDQVVTKCEHTMHKSCWDENNYHCPEYGDRCKKGSHYYNHENLLDRKNASFYMPWLLNAVVAAMLTWVVLVLLLSQLTIPLLHDFFLPVYDFDASSTEEADAIAHYKAGMLQWPFFGLFYGFFLTAGLALLTVRRYTLLSRLANVFLRGLQASIVCFLAFLLTNLLTGLLHLTDYFFFFVWIPWTISAFVIVFSASVKTRVKQNPLFVLLTVIVGFATIAVWLHFFVDTKIDFRVLLLISYIIAACGLAICLAFRAPRSDRFFLHVSGAVKDMDIALYKWFRTDPHTHVTLGRSIDCSLQLSWDTEGVVDAQHAELVLDSDIICLRSLGGEVLVNGRPLADDKTVPLYHGHQFTIGRTTFTYVEKDR